MTEAKKFDDDKPRYDLIPPEIEEAIAKVLSFGAMKYAVEARNEWQRLLLAEHVEQIQLITPSGCAVNVTRSTCGQPIPSLQNANVKIAEIGKPETLTKSESWQSVEELIQRFVQGIKEPSGSTNFEGMGSRKNPTLRYVPKGAPFVALPSTCTLTIVTKLGGLEVSFAPGATTDSVFWATLWKGLSEHFSISRPQNKTGERNWELGMRWGRPYAALRRHMAAWWSGEDTDPETGMSHLWHAACCIAFLTAFEARKAGTDDRPSKETK
jgi:hypothetical protein